MGWRRYAKPQYGMIAGFLLLVGVIVPAVFGLLTEKAMEIGTADLLDKSTNWDSTNIANSTYFVEETDLWGDNATASKYVNDIIYDDSSDMDLVMFDTSGTISSSYTGLSDYGHIDIWFNKTNFVNDVDKVVVLFRIEDKANLNLDNALIEVLLRDNIDGLDYSWEEIFNATDAYNGTIRVEFTIDAVKRLKIQASDRLPAVYIFIKSKDGQIIDLDNVVVGYRVELYDVKKVNASAISNTMLVTAGLLSWVGAFAATPYWNPMKDPSHRNVRRITRKIRRRRGRW